MSAKTEYIFYTSSIVCIIIIFIVLIILCIVKRQKTKLNYAKWIKLYNKKNTSLSIEYTYKLYDYHGFNKLFENSSRNGIWDMMYIINNINTEHNLVEFQHFIGDSDRKVLKCSFYKNYKNSCKSNVLIQFHSPKIINDFLDAHPTITLKDLKNNYPKIYAFVTDICTKVNNNNKKNAMYLQYQTKFGKDVVNKFEKNMARIGIKFTKYNILAPVFI